MTHILDEDILTLEKALGCQKWPYLEKRYLNIFCFYLIHIAGRIYYKEPGTSVCLLIKCSDTKKELAKPRLLSFFKQIIKQEILDNGKTAAYSG